VVLKSIMYIAIDDTYGPEVDTGSEFVTGRRRTYVAVIFRDAFVQLYRDQIVECIDEIKQAFGLDLKEFHFVDIYNRKSPLDKLPAQGNLGVFKAFAEIYQNYRWPVIIQTVDDRTFRDHGIESFAGHIESIDLSERGDLSLLWLLIKIKLKYKQKPESITLYVDEGQGRKKPGTSIGSAV
jgi:hypothetical protein